MSYRVAVVGATGAVGTVMLAKLRERGFPACEIVPFASERSAGRELDGAHRPAAERRDDPGLRHRDLLRRRRDLRRVGAALRRRRRGRRRQLLQVAPRPRGPARRRRGQPRRARGPQGPDRQPELLDDAADGRAEADPRRRRHRAPDRLDLPVGVGHRREGGRGARGADPRGPARASRCRSRRSIRTRSPSTCTAAPATSWRRPHRRRAQDDVRDAQDPRRRVDRDQRHLRARARPQLPLGVRDPADARAAGGRGGARAAGAPCPASRWSSPTRPR